MNLPEQKRIEDFIKSLGRDELLYLNRLVVERLKLLSQAESTQVMSRFNVGDLVEFTANDGKPVRGIIFKLNKKTVSLKTTEGQQWNVAPQLLREVRTDG